MRLVSFVDYSDPLGGLLSWISVLCLHLKDFELNLVGVVTDESRSAWAGSVDADAPVSMIPVHRDEVTAVEHVTSPEQLPDKLRAIITRRSVFIPNAYETGYRLGALARRLGIPSSIVTFNHSDEPHYYYLAERYEPLVSKFLAADSRSYQGMLNRLPHRQRDIVKAPHGLRAPAELERRPDRQLRLLYVGRVVQRQKQIFDMIVLAQAVRALKVSFRLDIIGDGEQRQALERAAARFSPEISCLGLLPRQEVLRRYRDYDCFILCSSFEGMSIALMEAMAHGVVPVVTRVGGAPDLITDGVEGFMWPFGKPSVAAERLHELWRDSERLRDCSRAAHARIVNAHNPERCAATVAELLRHAAASPRGTQTDAQRLLSNKERSPHFAES